MKQITTIAFFIYSLVLSTTLLSQDVAISGLNTDTPDGFTLVALVDIPNTQNIFFTDQSWNPTTDIFEDFGGPSINEGSVRITWTGTWAKGTMIQVIDNNDGSSAPFNVSTSIPGPSGAAATLVTPGDGFSIGGNEVYSVYSASSTTMPETNVTEIYTSVEMSSGGDGNPADDPDCPCSSSFVEVNFNNSSVDYLDYTTADRDGVTLAEFTNTSNYSTSNSPGTMNTSPLFTNLMFGGSGLLPIELSYFNAKKMNAEAMIMWTTATETNNDYFEIERSNDGSRFDVIGSLNGGGDSYTALNYTFMDKNPERGINYYRLKQTDFDGKFSYSPVAVLEFDKIGSGLTISPNPFINEVNIDLPNAFNQNVDIKIFDSMGRLVSADILEKEQTQKNLNLSDLNPGIYMIQIGEGANAIIHRIAKF